MEATAPEKAPDVITSVCAERQKVVAAARQRSAPPQTDRTRSVQRLAQQFVREPELVLTLLEGIEHQAPRAARMILEASQAALVENPEYAELLYCAGRAAWAAGAYPTADTLLDQALQINPAYKDAIILAARVALLRNLPDRATRLLETALAAGAQYPDVHMLLGDICRSRRQWKRARAAYSSALELNPVLPAAREALAELPSSDLSGKSHELST